MAIPSPFCLFSFFSHNLQNTNVDFSRIRTRSVGVEGDHADHKTTATTTNLLLIPLTTLNLIPLQDMCLIYFSFSGLECLLLTVKINLFLFCKKVNFPKSLLRFWRFSFWPNRNFLPPKLLFFVAKKYFRHSWNIFIHFHRLLLPDLPSSVGGIIPIG